MKKIIAVFTAMALIMGLCACSKKVEEPTWQEQFDLGILSQALTGSFDINGANISADLLTIAMRIPWPDSQNDEHFSMFMNFCRKSDSQFVLIECEMHR